MQSPAMHRCSSQKCGLHELTLYLLSPRALHRSSSNEVAYRDQVEYLPISPNTNCESGWRSALVPEILDRHRELALPSWKSVCVFYVPL